MKIKERIFNIAGFVTLILMLYCMGVFIFLQRKLTFGLLNISPAIKGLGDSTVIMLFFAGLFHLYLLYNCFRNLKCIFLDSLYIILIIISGASLFGDIVMLSDIGKEYLYRDIAPQFALLYIFVSFQTVIVSLGILKINKIKSNL